MDCRGPYDAVYILRCAGLLSSILFRRVFFSVVKYYILSHCWPFGAQFLYVQVILLVLSLKLTSLFICILGSLTIAHRRANYLGYTFLCVRSYFLCIFVGYVTCTMHLFLWNYTFRGYILVESSIFCS